MTLSRYQTGPFVTIGIMLVMVLLFVLGLHEAIWRHHWNGWLSAATAILMLFNFHRLFYRPAD